MDEYNNDLEEPSRKVEDVPSEQTNRPGEVRTMVNTDGRDLEPRFDSVNRENGPARLSI